MTSARQPPRIGYRHLRREDLARVGDIDRTERIDTLLVQRGVELEERPGDWSARAWLTDGDGEHSVEGQRRACEAYVDAGGVALGAFDGERLVGIGIVKPHLRPGVAQLAFLHVSDGYRGLGIGGRISDDLEEIARNEGDTSMVVSATPSQNTVRFYLGRGFEPMATPLPELFALEPEDVHLSKEL